MISIIIPIFNEERRLKKNIETIFSFINKQREKFEVLLVDDGSFDFTPKILTEVKRDYPVRVITHKINLGKGAAIRTGVNEAKGELIIFTDIDLSVSIDYLKKYLDVLDSDTDIIIGSRVKPGAQVVKRQFWLRELLGESFTYLSNLILGVNVTDFTCGFKLFRREAALVIFNKLRINRWAFDAEALFLARKNKFKINEVPVRWEHREGSKVRFPRDLIESLIGLFKIRLNNLLGRYD